MNWELGVVVDDQEIVRQLMEWYEKNLESSDVCPVGLGGRSSFVASSSRVDWRCYYPEALKGCWRLEIKKAASRRKRLFES